MDPAFVFERLYQRCREELRRGSIVIVDTCALRVNDRMALLRMASEARARTEVVVFTTLWHECRERDVQRGQRASGVSWDETRKRMAESLRAIPGEQWDVRTFVPYARRVSLVCWSRPMLRSS